MKVIELLKKTFLYKWYHKNNLKHEQELHAIRNKYFLAEGEELLRAFAEAMNGGNIQFWLEFGSLLGYYRENDFIKHDCDIDFGAFLKDRHVIKEALENSGFQLIHQFLSSDGGVEECYKYKHTSIDLFYFREDNELLYCNTFIMRYPMLLNKFIRSNKCLVKRIDIPNQPLTKVCFKGVEVSVPIDCEKHLEMHYGKSFMIPNPNFSFKKDATNITYYKYNECKGQMFVFGEKI